MGRRGPPPEPTQLRVLKGNSAHRPLPKDEPQPKIGRPRMPQWLMPEAKRHWRLVVPQLEATRVLTVEDGSALAAMCESWARWQRAELELIEKGDSYDALSYVDKEGIAYTVEKPRVAVKVAKDEKTAYLRWCQEFGRTPSARTRVRTAVVSGDKGDDELLNRSGGRA